MIIRQFEAIDSKAVIALWQTAGLIRPWNDPAKDIARKLAYQRELFLVGELHGEVIASAMGGYDGHRGSLYYMAVSPDHQCQAYGAMLVKKLETLLLEMGCPKINLMVRGDNTKALGFYERIGYEGADSAILGKRLIPD